MLRGETDLQPCTLLLLLSFYLSGGILNGLLGDVPLHDLHPQLQ